MTPEETMDRDQPSTGEVPEPAGIETTALEARIADLEDRWRRALADLDNARKRHERDLQRVRLDERIRAAVDWLPVLDNLDRALEHASGDPEAIVEGVEAVRDQAVALLAALGFPRHDEIGTRFDPNLHEAIATVADPEAEPGTVVHVVRPGYGDGDQQLRPAAVVVVRGAE